jgi:serine protease inhibitor
MPKKMLACLIAAVTLVLPATAGCGRVAPVTPIALAAEVPAKGSAAGSVSTRVVDATNDFGFRLARMLSPGTAEGNVLISPLSVAAALAMTREGAAGTTKDGITKALGLDGIPDDEVGGAYANMIASLPYQGRDLQLEVANALFADDAVAFKADFLQRNRDWYAAQVTTLDLSAPAAKDAINAWVEERTHGRIDRIVERTEGDVLELLNAVYFNGKWQDAFEKRRTQDGPFFPSAGTTITVPMMERSVKQGRYVRTETFQALELPYRGGRYGMVIVLPSPTSTLDAVTRDLTAEDWRDLMDATTEIDGQIQLPRFRLEYDSDLKAPLTALGMGSAFNVGADLSRMVDAVQQGGLWLGTARHKAFVSVDESGTEAAAVTHVSVYGGIGAVVAPPDFFSMIVQRPFLFAIRDDKTGALLFLGMVRDPRK